MDKKPETLIKLEKMLDCYAKELGKLRDFNISNTRAKKLRELYESYTESPYDMNFIIDRAGDFLGGRLLLAGGGPTVWLDTKKAELIGIWGETITKPVIVPDCISDFLEDQYELTK